MTDHTLLGERIAKVIAATGLCSRRWAEQMIMDRRITVNGLLVTNVGMRVSSTDAIAVDGRNLITTMTTMDTRCAASRAHRLVES